MKKLFTTLVAFVAVAGIEPAWSASDEPLFSVQSLGNGVHVVFGDGGNVSVAEVGDSLLVVDSKIGTDSEALKRQIKAISSKPISIITNTHWHYDHVGGNEALGGGVIPILAHDKVRERMAKGQRIELFNKDVPPAAPRALPMMTFGRNTVLYLGGETISLLHLPSAHTDGDTIIHFEQANTIHMGDIFFNGMYPFIDLGSGGSVQGVLSAVNTALRMSDENTFIIPGHGSVTNQEGLKAYKDMLSSISIQIGSMIGQRKTMQQVIDSKPTQEFDASFQGAVIDADTFTSIVYKSLIGGRR
jgi:cyclase